MEKMKPSDIVEVEAPAVQMAQTNSESTLIERGIDFYRSGDLEKAETVFEAVLQEDPYNPFRYELSTTDCFKTGSA